MHHLPAGNVTQRLPHLALKRGTRRGGWQGINNAEIALEVGRQFIAQPARIMGSNTLVTLGAIMDVEQLNHPVAVLFPLNSAQIERFIRDNPQRPQRRRNLIFE